MVIVESKFSTLLKYVIIEWIINRLARTVPIHSFNSIQWSRWLSVLFSIVVYFIGKITWFSMCVIWTYHTKRENNKQCTFMNNFFEYDLFTCHTHCGWNKSERKRMRRRKRKSVHTCLSHLFSIFWYDVFNDQIDNKLSLLLLIFKNRKRELFLALFYIMFSR